MPAGNAIDPKKQVPDKRKPNVSSSRESVETFVFVFLFFLVLGVEAEGFVIPTGSMAPTLMGRHKEVACPECGFVFAVNADGEIGKPDESRPEGRWVEAGTCVNCRYQARIGDQPNFQGDRIYVMKTPLNLPFLSRVAQATLKRWDVAVFKLPEEPEVRYIKRLVGMPDEIVRILRGDIWTRPRSANDEPFRRALRPLKHQEAMQIMVFDDAHRAKALSTNPEWLRWLPRQDGGWANVPRDTHVYQAKVSEDWNELRYRHVVPDPAQWSAISRNQELANPPRRTLITDFYSYNTEVTADSLDFPESSRKAWSQANWVGDLTLRFSLDVRQKKGAFRVELVKAGIANRCEIDLASDSVTIWRGAAKIAGPQPAGINGTGRHSISFANVDDRLTIKIDGRLPFGEGVSYDPGEEIAPNAADLDPAGVASRGADVAVSGLVLTRDIYYTHDPAHADLPHFDMQYLYRSDPVAVFDWLADPSHFSDFAEIPPKDFEIAPGRYMMLGDNSPWSRDGRDWNRNDQIDSKLRTASQGWDDSGRASWEVPEALLIGKAFCVYWPHLTPFGPKIPFGRDIRIPARPSVEKMRWIR